MSIQIIGEVLDRRQELDGPELILMLALADHANDEGVLWPSNKRLAKRMRRSERTVQRTIASFEERGYLTREARVRDNGSQQSNLITLCWHVDENGRVQGGPAGGGDIAVSPPHDT